MRINMSSPTKEVLEAIATGKTDADDLELISVLPSTDTAKLAEQIYVDVFGKA